MAAQAQPRTLFDKIWASHVVAELSGGVSLLAIDRHLMHDLEAGAIIKRIADRGLRPHNPELTFGVPDHAVATDPRRRANSTPNSERLLREMKEGSDAFGITYFDLDTEGQGIVHVIGPELGLSQPGMTIVCADSHTCTHGGLGALSFGIGATEVAHVLATQTLRQTRPKTMRVNFNGKVAAGVTAKDLILATIGKIGTGAGRGHAVEYAGDAIRAMSIDERLTVCNLSIELGAKIGMIAPDDTTFEFLAGRRYAPQGDMFERALGCWRGLPTDEGARFDVEHSIDVDTVAPQVTWGTSPQDVIAVDSRIPDPSRESDPQRRKAMEAALAYMGLAPGAAIEGTPIDWVFIGSCTNGRLSDIREAARIVAGRKIAPNVRAWVVPGSEATQRAAEREGLDKVFLSAGFEWRKSGCSMCAGVNGDIIAPGQRSVSTTNRNFVGRQGPNARTHLASPAMAAAAALSGCIADARKIG
ncbi:MAG TPA: 3-isopropylmalate dehydratase large subunit [Pseudolabrys sp.]|jgi:3-isopropylmalate/(R)-2-methylmalate dehydratase large subunit|nr:3-isopropylmalate dehydratase large subunit [Pseudolabrys sp.]